MKAASEHSLRLSSTFGGRELERKTLRATL
jgi:hypothetical protein